MSELPENERPNRSLAAARPPAEQANVLKSLYHRSLLTWKLLWDGRVSLLAKIIPFVAIAYLVSPVDFLPALVTGPLGTLDDAGVLLVALNAFVELSPPDIVREHLRALGAVVPERFRPDDVIDVTPDIIED